MSTSSQYLSLQPSYTIDLNQGQQQEIYDHHHHHHQILLHHHSFSGLQPQPSSSSSSSFPLLSSPSSSLSPIYSNAVQDQLGYLYMGSQLQPPPYHQEVDNNFGTYGSYDQTTLEINKGSNRTNLKFTICKKEEQNFSGGNGGGGDEINGPSVNWMPLRLMKKMMRADEDQKKQLSMEPETGHLMNNNDNSTIRVCSDCNTTKTPLWRSGPRGPKSLCNACGIRQRKARRAMAMATNGPMSPNSTPSTMMRVGNGHKKTVNNNGFGAQKKRSKVAKPPSRDNHHNDSQRKLRFDEFVLKLSKKLSLQQVFPQEEKEAAILLMALSYGIVHG